MKRAFTLIEMLVVITIIAILLGITIPAVQYARELSRRTSCSNNLRQIGVSSLSYQSTNRYFPTAGLHDRANDGTWNLPDAIFIDSATKQEISLPTNRPTQKLDAVGWAVQIQNHNEQNTSIYTCPTRGRRDHQFVLDYAGNGGASTPAFPQQGCDVRPDGVITPVGHFNPQNRFVRQIDRPSIGNIDDGASQVILIGERCYDLGSEGEEDTHPTENNGYRSGWTWDSIRWGLEPPQQDFRGSSARFGSSHDVVFFLYCDGRVSPLDYSINPTTFKQLCSRNDGGIISE